MNRTRWIDMAKGIGILLVMLAHSRFANSGYCEHWITSFHMPLFFVLAGICYDEARYPSLLGYCKRKSYALIYPYFTLSVVIMCVAGVFCLNDTYTVSTAIDGMLHGATVAPMWFIRVLLVTELLYACVAQMVRHGISRVVICFLLALMATFLSGYSLWKMDVAVVALAFYGCGHLLRAYVKGLLEPPMSLLTHSLGWSTIVAHALLVAYVAPYTVQFGMNCLGVSYYFFPLAFLGVGGIVYLCLCMDRMTGWLGYACDALAFLGKNSIILLALHPIAGVCRKSWVETGVMGAATAQFCELCLLSGLVYALACPFRWMIVYPRDVLVRVLRRL